MSWKVILGDARTKVGIAVLGSSLVSPVVVATVGNLLWLDDHRKESPGLIESYRNDHYEIQELKREVGRLIVSVEKLTSEIREEREQRLRRGK